MSHVLDLARRNWFVLVLLAAAFVVFILVWFQPQKLFIDQQVAEDFPLGAGTEPAAPENPTEGPDGPEPTVPASEMQPDEAVADEMPEPAEPVLEASGSFTSRSHPTSGTASAYTLEDGSRVLRLEDLRTDNGPDLYVYLSSAGPDAPAGMFDDDAINLGRLKGNIGSQNYDIPADADLSRYSTVVIWCDRFTVVFGVADMRA